MARDLLKIQKGILAGVPASNTMKASKLDDSSFEYANRSHFVAPSEDSSRFVSHSQNRTTPRLTNWSQFK